MPLEKVVQSPVLRRILATFDPKKKHDRAVIQAAAWHLANDIDWEELKNKQQQFAGIGFRRYFTAKQLESAKSLVADTRPAPDESVVSARTKPAESAPVRTGAVSRD